MGFFFWQTFSPVHSGLYEPATDVPKGGVTQPGAELFAESSIFEATFGLLFSRGAHDTHSAFLQGPAWHYAMPGCHPLWGSAIYKKSTFSHHLLDVITQKWLRGRREEHINGEEGGSLKTCCDEAKLPTKKLHLKPEVSITIQCSKSQQIYICVS